MTHAPRDVIAGSIGVFGGTFDPIHVAHLAVAQEAAESLGLERVLFVPAGVPPHKPGRVISAAEHRLAMVELAVAGNPRFAVDHRELDREGPSYTVDTLSSIRSERMAAGLDPEVRLIVSTDAFLGFMTWHEPQRVVELARIVVAPRDGHPDAGPDFVARHMPDAADRVTFLDWPRMRLSGSDLRRRAASGRSLRYLVPDAVAAYIGDHALYTDQRRDP